MSLQEQIQGLNSTIRNLCQVNIPDISALDFYVMERISSHGKEIRLVIAIPYNVDYFRQVRKLFGSQWKREGRLTRLGQSTDWAYYKHKNAENIVLDIEMSTMLSGSTCRKVKVGEETVDKYEIVCN